MAIAHAVRVRAASVSLAALLGLAGCAAPNAPAPSAAPPPMRPPVRPGMQPAAAPKKGLSTGQKLLLVGGAAAVYYLYKKHQNAKGQGPKGRYYLSKNGRVYYRDLKTGAYRWVDAPKQPLQVPAAEYERYTGQRAPAGGGVIRQAPAGWNTPAR